MSSQDDDAFESGGKGAQSPVANGDDTGSRSVRSRRRLIQLLAAGGVVSTSRLVPGQWSSPVVKSVVVPAHAQTTEPGETCRLGNNTIQGGSADLDPVAYDRESVLASGGSPTATMASLLVPDAYAQDEALNPCVPLGGCFRIEFPCNSDSGTLFVVVGDLESDSADPTTISVPFQDGVEGMFDGGAGDVCFRVTLGSNGESALLEIDCGCVGKGVEAITLVENFDCVPGFVVIIEDNF